MAVAGGPFIVGEIITGDTSGAKAQVVEAGEGILLIADISGIFDTSTPDNIAGGTSGASAAISSKTARPYSLTGTTGW